MEYKFTSIHVLTFTWEVVILVIMEYTYILYKRWHNIN